jgi:hypothetical protein
VVRGGGVVKISRAIVLNHIRHFEAAHDEYLLRGAGDPRLVEDIEANYHKQRELLIRWIIKIAFEFGEKV